MYSILLTHVTVSLLSTLSLLPKCEGFGNSWSSPMIVAEQPNATLRSEENRGGYVCSLSTKSRFSADSFQQWTRVEIINSKYYPLELSLQRCQNHCCDKVDRDLYKQIDWYTLACKKCYNMAQTQLSLYVWMA